MAGIELPEILVSVDGEFTGPIPGSYSMISLGAVAYDPGGEEISRFKVNMLELSGAGRDPVTRREFWDKYPEAWTLATQNPIDPKEAMHQFDDWLSKLPGRPKLMGWPLPVDFMFIYWYYVKFMDKVPPFGYDGIDIKSYAMAKMGCKTLSGKPDGVSRRAVQDFFGIPTDNFSHDPLDDAIKQAELYFCLREMN